MTFEELNEVRALKKQIAAAKQKITALRDSVESITPKLQPTPKIRATESRVEVLTALIVDTESRVNELQARLQKKILTENLVAAEQTLLIYRYVACKYFRDIGFLMGFSERRVYQVHDQILKKIAVDCS